MKISKHAEQIKKHASKPQTNSKSLTTDPKPNWLNLKCFLFNLAKLYKACQALQTATKVINLVDLVKERKAVERWQAISIFSFYLNKSAY